MKKQISALIAAVMLAGSLTAGGALADSESYVYGTMQIPYDEFYAAEGVASAVDAVSSATDSKWKNTDLTAGTYNAPHSDDNGGDILGVTYPVAITQSDLDALGEDSHAFTALDGQPAAYKIASVADGSLSFSAVQGDAAPIDASATISTDSPWGDYQITVDAINNAKGTSDIGTLYGVLLRTDDGTTYGLRHLENIWNDSLAWSVGFKTTEALGNVLSSEAYADMMGKTISEITYITETGYHTLAVELYVPVKFDGGAEVASVPAASGSAPVTLTGLPEDYAPEYAVDGLTAEVSDGSISFGEALPGAYTLTVTDSAGKYAPFSADFVLSTDAMPVVFDPEAGAIVAAEGSDAELAAAFIANLSTVTVNDASYAASGRGAVMIINAEGEVDADAAIVSGRGADAVSTPVFEADGEYSITVASTGFDQTLSFTVTIAR